MSDLSMIEQLCTSLHKESGDILSWEFDSRFEMALTVFDSPVIDQVLDILNRHFESTFDIDSIQSSPPDVQGIVGNYGGIRPEQKLFLAKPDSGAKLLAMWWPWGGGERVSLRIGYLGDASVSPSIDQFKVWFGV